MLFALLMGIFMYLAALLMEALLVGNVKDWTLMGMINAEINGK